jgi:hypothetical protein
MVSGVLLRQLNLPHEGASWLFLPSGCSLTDYDIGLFLAGKKLLSSNRCVNFNLCPLSLLSVKGLNSKVLGVDHNRCQGMTLPVIFHDFNVSDGTIRVA